MGYASKFGHTDTVALLVKAGADVNPCALVGCVGWYRTEYPHTPAQVP